MSALGFWGGTCALFSFFIASGNLLFGLAILGALLLYLAVLSGPQLLAYFWILGQPTIFGFPNQILKAALPFITMERLLFLVLLGMMVARIVFVKTKHPRLLPLEILIIVFLSYALISLGLTATSASFRQDIWFFMQYAIPMTMFIVGRRMEWSERGLKILLASMSVAGVFLTVVGVLQVFFNIDILTMEYQEITVGHRGRAHGAFTNAATYTATLLIFFLLTLFQYSIYRDSFVKFLLIIAMLAMSLGIIVGQTRAPWVGFAGAIFIIYLRDRNIRTLVTAGVMAALAGGGLALLFMADHLDGLLDRIADLDTMADRVAIWATAINMIAHNPVFGVGFGSDAFSLHKYEYITSIWSVSVQHAVFLQVPHNDYLHIGVQLGMLGLILFLGISYYMARLPFQIHLDEENSPMRKALSVYVGAIVMGLLFNNFFSDTYLQDYFWMLTYFLTGLVAGMPRNFGLYKNGLHSEAGGI